MTKEQYFEKMDEIHQFDRLDFSAWGNMTITEGRRKQIESMRAECRYYEVRNPDHKHQWYEKD